MARKVSYSKPLKYFWKQLYGIQKKLTPDFTNEEIYFSLKRNLIKLPLANGETQEDRQLMISGVELWRTDSKGELLHIFFLDKQLRDFLEITPLSDLGGIKKFLSENGEYRDVFHSYANRVSNNLIYQFALHLPNEADGYAFSLSIEDDGALELYFSIGAKNGRVSDKFYTDTNKKDDEVSITISNMYRLAINTIAYMNCFPECVADGVPNDLFEKSVSNADRNFTFQLSEKIKDVDYSSTSKIPHFRRGFFRYLQSDYYTHKKGKVVFIGETMVKGKAKTVSMSLETDEFLNKTSETLS